MEGGHASRVSCSVVNGTWILVDQTGSKPGKSAKIRTSRWVLRIKRDENGKILRCKFRLIIDGYKQLARLECDREYSPVVRIPTIRFLFLIAKPSVLAARHIDDETMFLTGWSIGVTIYMAQPALFEDGTRRSCLL